MMMSFGYLLSIGSQNERQNMSWDPKEMMMGFGFLTILITKRNNKIVLRLNRDYDEVAMDLISLLMQN
jgi:hypothetical protein